MLENYWIIAVYIISGIASGVFVGMGSGTTGAIMVTALVVVLNHSIHDAIGTTLMIDATIGLVAGLIFLKKGNVKLKPIIFLIVFCAIGSFIGSRFTSRAPESGLMIGIGLLLIAVGISFAAKGLQKNLDYIGDKLKVDKLKKYNIIIFLLFGSFIGFISGFTGMGIGGVLAIMLILLLDYDLHKAIGTSLIMLFFISGAGATGHILNNEFVFESIFFVGVSAVIGASLGSIYANRLNEDKLGRLIGVIIVILGFTIFLKVFL